MVTWELLVSVPVAWKFLCGEMLFWDLGITLCVGAMLSVGWPRSGRYLLASGTLASSLLSSASRRRWFEGLRASAEAGTDGQAGACTAALRQVLSC